MRKTASMIVHHNREEMWNKRDGVAVAEDEDDRLADVDEDMADIK